MFEWLNNYSRIDYRAYSRRMDFGGDTGVRFNKVEVDKPNGITTLAQYFLAGNVWLTDNFRVGIPVRNRKVLQRVMQEVAPHFTDVKQCVRDGFIETVYLQAPRPESLELFKQTETEILPIMKDLYRHQDISVWYSGKKRRLVHYTVNLEVLEPYNGYGIQEVQDLLRTAYFEDGGESFALMPLGWTMGGSLKDSAALRFLAGFVPFLKISVDEENGEVLLLEMSQDEFVHEVYLKTAYPLPPRRQVEYLYLDIGNQLVYVVNLAGQSPVTVWDELHDTQVYYVAEGSGFAEFNHETAERIREGSFVLFEEDKLKLMVEVVNGELRK